jgi:DHA2 family multidrug resistance protein
MTAQTTAAALPSARQIVQATARAVPSELSKSPLLGILGVIMGAGIVTLTGRMISLGLADLKGHAGISFDDGAWISSAYNIALMFIGPFTVYLGGLMGPRRILFFAASAFTAICALLPLIHNYSLLIVALALAGLTSGTFYPLTLTFALRNIPLKFLPFTIALYATFVDGAVNVAPTLYGWYREHLSWEWMFWNSAVITPVMALCVYYGIPATAPPKRSSAAASFAGFLYASAGLAMLYAAIDQGERLDWWRSGVFTALFVGGSLFVFCGLVRRLRSPNPLVDLPYLGQWNIILLGLALVVFRFNLLSTIILVPQSLSVHGFEANQIGPAVIWCAIPLIPLAFAAGVLLLSDFDTRLLMAIGFGCMAFAAYLNAELSTVWSAANYYRTELLLGMGQSFAFIGLVSTIILQGIFSGGLARPQSIMTFSAYFHTARLFGGQIGAVFMGHFIAQQEKLHSNLLGLHVQRGNWISDGHLHSLTAGLFAKSAGLEAATGRAIGLTSARLRLEAFTLTFIDGFHLLAWSCVLALVLIVLMRKAPLRYGEMTAIQQHLAAPEEGR